MNGLIVIIYDAGGAGLKSAPTRGKRYPLSEIVRAFKSFSARRINEIRNAQGRLIWQRNYYYHIIRNHKFLNRIREYIRTNPERWQWDKENPNSEGTDHFDQWLDKEIKKENPQGIN